MKVAITGTTGGLGSALVQAFQREYLFGEVIELNRPEYTVGLDESRLFNVDFDIFINNAYSDHNGFAQVELLYGLYELNKHRECHIINIGSVSGDGDRHKVYPYGVHKAALEKASTQLSLVDGPCKVSLVKPGRMNTKRTEHRKEYYRIDPIIVARTVLWVATQPKEINVKSITVDAHNANRKLL